MAAGNLRLPRRVHDAVDADRTARNRDSTVDRGLAVGEDADRLARIGSDRSLSLQRKIAEARKRQGRTYARCDFGSDRIIQVSGRQP
ncbi:hypothetical protein CWS35_13000 [Bradyrhizobium sp. SK17]|nr:hypothetical protein CWS35_13000 [Bradyrhizobium sp. SK17]